MKQFFTVFKFEYGNYIKGKTFLIMTIVFAVIIGALLSFPRLIGVYNNVFDSAPEPDSVSVEQPADSSDQAAADSGRCLLAVQTADVDAEHLLQFLSSQNANISFTLTDMSEHEIYAAIETEKYDSGLIMLSPTHFKHLRATNGGMLSVSYSQFTEVIKLYYQTTMLGNYGIQPQTVFEILAPPIIEETISIGKDPTQTYFFTYALIFVLYFSIILYGQMVATSVASEKSSRMMELLTVSAKPLNLMFGKIIGTGLAGLTQFGSLILSAFAFYAINESYWSDNWIVQSIFNVPTTVLILALVFFVLGYFLYAFLYGALGSLVSRVEDINTAVLPVTFMVIIIFFLSITGMTSDPNSLVMKIGSFIPFSAPMMMFVRVCMAEVAAYEIAICMTLLVATVGLIGYISATIYRYGVLMYGKPPKFNELIKIIKSTKYY